MFYDGAFASLRAAHWRGELVADRSVPSLLSVQRDDSAVLVSDVGYVETRAYVRRVLQNVQTYRVVYGD